MFSGSLKHLGLGVGQAASIGSLVALAATFSAEKRKLKAAGIASLAVTNKGSSEARSAPESKAGDSSDGAAGSAASVEPGLAPMEA